MKQRPILFSAPMVRALLDGSKTQTRRVVKLNDRLGRFDKDGYHAVTDSTIVRTPWTQRTIQKIGDCPYGQPGDQLWVRETFQPTFAPNIERDDTDWETGKGYQLRYSATDERVDWMDGDDNITRRCKPAIHMPRWASRITLEIVSVCVERLQDISEADCVAEGCAGGHGAIPGYGYAATPLEHYHWLWNSINGPGSWEANPWVWVVEFEAVKP